MGFRLVGQKSDAFEVGIGFYQGTMSKRSSNANTVYDICILTKVAAADGLNNDTSSPDLDPQSLSGGVLALIDRVLHS
jgi:hypothetical protein